MSNDSTPSVPTSPISAESGSEIVNDSAAEYSPEVMAALKGEQVPEKIEEKEEIEAEKPEAKKTDFLAPKFAALARREREAKAYEAKVRAREQAVEAKMAELQGKASETEGKLKSFEDAFNENPLKAIKERGLTLEQLIEIQMNDENPTPDMKIKRAQQQTESALKAEIEAIKKQLQDEKEAKLKAEEDRATSEYTKTVENYKSELSKFAQTNADTYELIVANDATDLMFQVAELTYEKYKRVPDIKEVADAVEAHLETEARRIFELKKFQKQTSKPTATSQQKKTEPTLSNTAAATVPSNGKRVMTAEESLKEAAKLIRWEE